MFVDLPSEPTVDKLQSSIKLHLPYSKRNTSFFQYASLYLSKYQLEQEVGYG